VFATDLRGSRAEIVGHELCVAKGSRVNSFLSWEFPSAPCSRSTRVRSTRPPSDAQCRGLALSSSWALAYTSYLRNARVNCHMTASRRFVQQGSCSVNPQSVLGKHLSDLYTSLVQRPTPWSPSVYVLCIHICIQEAPEPVRPVRVVTPSAMSSNRPRPGRPHLLCSR
jgi:hypothetical protein